MFCYVFLNAIECECNKTKCGNILTVKMGCFSPLVFSCCWFLGNVTNIPDTMIPNQFGIVGLLTFIRAAESDPSLVSLALGQDLTALGLNLNSPDNLYLTFAGPWADMPCR